MLVLNAINLFCKSFWGSEFPPYPHGLTKSLKFSLLKSLEELIEGQ